MPAFFVYDYVRHLKHMRVFHIFSIKPFDSFEKTSQNDF